MRIAVFSTYDVSPGENGGEARYLALYSRLAKTHDVRIVAYHANTSRSSRTERLGPGFTNVVCGISEPDKWRLHSLFAQTGRYLHDILCIEDYGFTDAFRAEARSAVDWADAVVVSHPYLAPFVYPLCRRNQLKVHEAHNVELDAKTSYLKGTRAPALLPRFLETVSFAESLAVRSADVVVAVSAADAQRLSDLHDYPASKLVVIPNGVTSADYDDVPAEAIESMRKAFAAPGGVGIFIGSAYGPNIDSYKQARLWLDAAGFTGKIIILGRMIEGRESNWPTVGFSESWLGFVDLETKILLMRSSDFALQIVTSGGGTNLKVFEYMAAGLPIVANTFGARSITDDGWSLPADNVQQLRALVAARAWASPAGVSAAKQARAIVEREFDWDVGARRYDAMFAAAAPAAASRPSPPAAKARRQTRRTPVA